MGKIQNKSGTALIGAIVGGGGGSGNVTGPGSSTADALARFSGTSGELLKDSAGLTYDGTDLTIQGETASRHGPEVFEIFSAADLPTPSGGTITLSTGVYIFQNSLTFSDTFTMAENADIEISAARPGIVLTYTGTGDFFVTVQLENTGSFLVQSIHIDLTNIAGQLFGLWGDKITLRSALFTFAEGELGELFADVDGIVIEDCRFENFDIGFNLRTIAGGSVYISGTWLLAHAGSSGTIVIFGTTATSKIDIANVKISSFSGTAFYVSPGFTGQANFVRIRLTFGDFFNDTGLDETSIYLNVQDSAPQKPSYTLGSSAVPGLNAVSTTINTVDVFEDLNLSSAVLGSNSEQWTLNSATTGEITYIGRAPFSGFVFLNLSARAITTTSICSLRAVVNGSPISDGIVSSVTFDTVALRAASFVAPLSVVTGDTVRIQIANESGTEDVDIISYSMAVR